MNGTRAAGKDGDVVVPRELLGAVDGAFAITGRDLTAWPDPHPDRAPLDDEYSRLGDPAKWRIIGARAEAWLDALVDAGLAVVDRNVSIQWRVEPATVIGRADRLVPVAAGALSLVVARSRLGDVDDAGVTLGVGDPAVCVTWLPSCGCDACDDGSQPELDRLDDHIVAVVGGAFRHLSAGGRNVTVLGEQEWSAAGRFVRHEVEAILADPAGWNELAGESWLSPD